jgi:hypothetical protein
LTVTAAVCTIPTLPFATPLIVFGSALVEEKLAWNTPVPSVVPRPPD